jgi:hypothetical protein
MDIVGLVYWRIAIHRFAGEKSLLSSPSRAIVCPVRGVAMARNRTGASRLCTQQNPV